MYLPDCGKKQILWWRHIFIRTIIFDFSGTDWMDSSGIGVILGRYKNMKLSGGHVYAVHLNERMKKYLRCPAWNT